MESIKKEQLVEAVAEKLGSTKKDALAAVNAVFDATKELVSVPDRKLTIQGFVSIKSEAIPEKVKKNNLTGENVTVAAHTKLSAKFSKETR